MNPWLKYGVAAWVGFLQAAMLIVATVLVLLSEGWFEIVPMLLATLAAYLNPVTELLLAWEDRRRARGR